MDEVKLLQSQRDEYARMAAKLDDNHPFKTVLTQRIKAVDARLKALRQNKVWRRHTKREQFYEDLGAPPAPVDVTKGASILRKYSVTAKRPSGGDGDAVLARYSATKKHKCPEGGLSGDATPKVNAAPDDVQGPLPSE